MNYQLMRVSLVVATVVNIFLASTIIYQNRSSMRLEDPRLPKAVSSSIYSLEKQLKSLKDKAESDAAKTEATLRNYSNQTEATLKNYANQIKDFATKSDKFESAGATVDKELHYIKDQLKKVVGAK